MVYVDPLMNHGWKLYGHPVKSCHLFADTEEELHEMARRLGLKRMWFQPQKGNSVAHYDITPKKRQRAVATGAQELGARQAVDCWRKIRTQQNG
jgi:hypothetical protein